MAKKLFRATAVALAAVVAIVALAASSASAKGTHIACNVSPINCQDGCTATAFTPYHAGSYVYYEGEIDCSVRYELMDDIAGRLLMYIGCCNYVASPSTSSGWKDCGAAKTTCQVYGHRLYSGYKTYTSDFYGHFAWHYTDQNGYHLESGRLEDSASANL